jgi:hypothetical protein
LFALHDSPRRWPVALRSALCLAAPVLVGWLAGDLNSGLTATLGGFTALYGAGRPYLNRAVVLGVVALALSACVGLGIWDAESAWAGVLTVAVIATVATVLCNAFAVGLRGLISSPWSARWAPAWPSTTRSRHGLRCSY